MSMIRPYITSAFKSLGRVGVPMKEAEKEVEEAGGGPDGRGGGDGTEGERGCALAGLTCDDITNTSYYWMFKIYFLIIAKAVPVNYFVNTSCRNAARSLFPAVFSLVQPRVAQPQLPSLPPLLLLLSCGGDKCVSGWN